MGNLGFGIFARIGTCSKSYRIHWFFRLSSLFPVVTFSLALLVELQWFEVDYVTSLGVGLDCLLHVGGLPTWV